MKIQFQISSASFSNRKFFDIHSEGYSVISCFLSSLKEKEIYKSRKRTYISKKTGFVKEYFSEEEFFLSSFYYDVDLLYPGGPRIVLNVDNLGFDRRLRILKRFLHEKAKKQGIYLYIFPFYNSPIKRKFIGYLDDIYRRVFLEGDSLEYLKFEEFFSEVLKYIRYLRSMPSFVHLLHWINYYLYSVYGKSFKLDAFCLADDSFNKAKNIYLEYIDSLDLNHLNKLFIFLNCEDFFFRALSDTYSIDGFAESFWENYVRLPFIEDYKVKKEIKDKIYQFMMSSYEEHSEYSGFYIKLREIFDYVIFLSVNFEDFLTNLETIFDDIKFNKYYFTFSFRSLSDISVSLKNIGFKSLDVLKKSFRKSSLDNFLYMDKSLKHLLDEFEMILLSRFV